jgi:hypothetical protein
MVSQHLNILTSPGIAVLIEIAAQPFYIIAQNLKLFGLRVSIEGAALAVKIATSFLLMLSTYQNEVR